MSTFDDRIKLQANGYDPVAVNGKKAILPNWSQLHDVSPVDPVSLGAALAVLTATATMAALLPARRAAKISPMEALRAD